MKHRRKIIAGIIVLLSVVFTSTSGCSAGTTTSEYTGNEYYHDQIHKGKILLNGIDVSAYQGEVDWQKVKSSGMDFAIIRIGGRGYESGALYEDEFFKNNIQKARDAGILVGTYFFSQATTKTEAAEEVDYLMKLLDGQDLDLPVYMDYENAGGEEGRLAKAQLTKIQATAIVNEFLTQIESRGYKGGFYSSTSFINEKIYGKVLGEYYSMWAAQYNDFCQYKDIYQIWQYTANGAVDGIEGAVDCNFMYIEKKSTISSDLSIADCQGTLTAPTMEFIYTEGASYTPQIKVINKDITLKENLDYKVRYIKNSKAGTAYAMVTGIGKYSDYMLIPFNINPELKTGKAVSGTVINMGNVSYDGMIVQLMGEDSSRSWFEKSIPAGANSFSFSNIPKGKYILNIVGKGIFSKNEAIEVDEEDVKSSINIYPIGDRDFDGKVDETSAVVISKSDVVRIKFLQKYNLRVDLFKKNLSDKKKN